MGEIPIETVRAIRQSTSRRLVAAGGVTTQREIDTLDALGGGRRGRDGLVFRPDLAVKAIGPFLFWIQSRNSIGRGVAAALALAVGSMQARVRG
jgi:hypothetical protein